MRFEEQETIKHTRTTHSHRQEEKKKIDCTDSSQTQKALNSWPQITWNCYNRSITHGFPTWYRVPACHCTKKQRKRLNELYQKSSCSWHQMTLCKRPEDCLQKKLNSEVIQSVHAEKWGVLTRMSMFSRTFSEGLSDICIIKQAQLRVWSGIFWCDKFREETELFQNVLQFSSVHTTQTVWHFLK